KPRASDLRRAHHRSTADRCRRGGRLRSASRQRLASMALGRPSATSRIVAGLLAGVVLGAIWPQAGSAVKALADLFLRLIRMVVAPLVFATLVVGVAKAGDLKAMGRIGLKAIVYFEAATTIALVLGLALVNLFKPGEGVSLPSAASTTVAGMAT